MGFGQRGDACALDHWQVQPSHSLLHSHGLTDIHTENNRNIFISYLTGSSRRLVHTLDIILSRHPRILQSQGITLVAELTLPSVGGVHQDGWALHFFAQSGDQA